MTDASNDGAAAVEAAVTTAAAELYALTPDEFTAARNARAGASDRASAAAIKALRKPSAAAWTINLLAREGRLTDALELAAALRDAQEDLDAAELARLGRQRRSLVSALARDAVALAAERGVTVGAAARDDLEKTINAAMMDAGAAAAVQSGRLVHGLEASGFDAVDISDAVAGAGPAAAAPRSRDDLAERRARKAAEQAAREADRLSSEAERALTKVEARLAKTRERADLLNERIDDLREQLARMERDAEAIEAEVRGMESEHRDAASAAKSAADRAERARAALDEG
ncbi:transposase [Microbacterium sp. Root61]|uniref:hypothetical protein n=1 Tax=Microbacterium sp. Root61 TaxID=1736570 RepID=UPI0006F1D23C|nr:hypothetical protein [Microbacterium sp. Root61]KRA25575.1 transposase [Microbacterium sp. Root61]